jgi:hypothetical protein
MAGGAVLGGLDVLAGSVPDPDFPTDAMALVGKLIFLDLAFPTRSLSRRSRAGDRFGS